MNRHHVGLDVSVKETSICIVHSYGAVVHRSTVESHPETISTHLISLGYRYSRIGLEAGALSPWLYAGLVEAGLPAICVETRHVHAALGLAQMTRVRPSLKMRCLQQPRGPLRSIRPSDANMRRSTETDRGENHKPGVYAKPDQTA